MLSAGFDLGKTMEFQRDESKLINTADSGFGCIHAELQAGD